MSQLEATDSSSGRELPGHRTGRFHGAVGKGLFEILIVAVGVMLALGADQWREKSEQRQLADEARATFRAETLVNREAILLRMRRTAALVTLVRRNPALVGDYVYERRNSHILIRDSAWIMAVETGALRWLTPDERSTIAAIYAGHERTREVVSQEMLNWAGLAAFQGVDDASALKERDRAIRVWLALAQRVQMAQCATVGRYERALGAVIPDAELVELCRSRPTSEDPADLYREFDRRGWASRSRADLLRQPARR